jgi:hypothetical protein
MLALVDALGYLMSPVITETDFSAIKPRGPTKILKVLLNAPYQLNARRVVSVAEEHATFSACFLGAFERLRLVLQRVFQRRLRLKCQFAVVAVKQLPAATKSSRQLAAWAVGEVQNR